MSEVTFDDWLWREQVPIEDLSEEELKNVKRIVDELAKLPSTSNEQVGDNMNERPVWNVHAENFSAKRIEVFNIFDHGYFWDACNIHWINAHDHHPNDIEAQIIDFKDSIDRELFYYFRSKSEWELYLESLFPDFVREKKIDVYDQVMLNKDIFLDYLWNWFEKKGE